jgi:hypothetical protein
MARGESRPEVDVREEWQEIMTVAAEISQQTGRVSKFQYG